VARNRIRLAVAVAAAGALLAVGAAVAPVGASAPRLGRFIVVLDDSVSAKGVLADHANRFGIRATGARVFEHAINGYAAELPTAALALLSGDARVKYIEVDGISTMDATQTDPPWGVDRSDQRAGLNGTFNYAATGAGVTAYILDTGIRYSHSDFGGRAVPGFDAVTPGGDAHDCNGHGSHTSGTVGGARFGIAKAVTLVSVRVLDCGGSAPNSVIIAGLDWVVANHGSQPAVANMSLSNGGTVFSMDAAVRRVIADGVQVVMSAGNGGTFGSGKDACKISPARTKEGITVAATDNTDTRASFSNYGPCVDLFAPGVNVPSVDGDSDTGSTVLSGTSMSAPHVAGVVAQYLQGLPNATPAAAQAFIINSSTKGIVKRANGGAFNNVKTPNRLLFTAQ
jgi:subtilisin family serine protease